VTAIENTVTRPSIEAVFQALLAIDLQAQQSDLRQKLLTLQSKLNSDQLHLAVLGQVKRGKSSFVNALLGAQVLPIGVLPVTAIVTEIRYGRVPEANVFYATGGMHERVGLDALPEYITEANNPGNRKQILSVEIAYPSPFLENGVVLIDTPGIGSTHAHNTRTTVDYLERVDAGIVVLSVDPPISDTEARFLSSAMDGIPKLFFVLNKIDTASGPEVEQISGFLEKELERLRIESPEIFPVSARQALLERQRDGVPSPASGLTSVEQRLRAFLWKEKRQILIRSVAQDVLQIAGTLRFAAAMGVRASTIPAEHLGRKQAELARLLERTDLEVQELKLLLRHRSSEIIAQVEEDLTTQVKGYVPQVRQHLEAFQAMQPKESGRRFGALLEGFLIGEIETVFRKWRIQKDEHVQAQLNLVSARFLAQANGILKRLETSAGALFGIPVQHLTVACPLRVESHLRYKVEPVFHSLDSYLLFFPSFLLRPIVFRRMRNNIPALLDINAGRIRYDYLERLQATIGRFEQDLSAAIGTVATSLKHAVLNPPNDTQRQGELVAMLDSAIRECSELLLQRSDL
jgi:GTPase Era involved in 16S rRNA processing